MGRPKGSKNKVKTTYDAVTVMDEVNGGIKVEAVPVKRIRKPKAPAYTGPTSPTLDKLLAAGFTAADLRAAIKEALANGEVTETKLVVEDKASERAALKAAMNAPISPAELTKLRKEAAAEMAKVKPTQLIVDEAVAQVIVPNWDKTPQDAAGLRHFLVKTIRNGDAVSFNKELWDKALETHKVRGKLTACKPEGSAEVEPQAGQRGAQTSLWRVMIG